MNHKSHLNVAFIGAGDISSLHAAGVEATPDATLVGIWNRTPQRARQRAAEFGCQIYDSVDSLVNDNNVDVVYVLTNLETHIEFAQLAIAAGKHVLVEKPVGERPGQILELAEAAEAAGVCCAPVHNYIYEPSLERSKEMIASGRLGKIIAFYMMYNIHHPEEVCARFPGVIRQILTHHAYTMIYLVGFPKAVSCMKSTVNDGSVPQENIAMLQCQLENGAMAHLAASFAADDHASDSWTCLIKVIGQEGATRFSYRDWIENQPGTVHSHTYTCYPDSIQRVSRYFLDETIRKGKPPLSTIRDAAAAAKLVMAAEESVATGRHVAL